MNTGAMLNSGLARASVLKKFKVGSVSGQAKRRGCAPVQMSDS